MRKLLLALALLWPLSAQAQDVTSHSVPVGQGPGVIGWGTVGPCGSGQTIIWSSLTTDPICGTPTASASIVIGSSTITGGTSGDVLYNTSGNKVGVLSPTITINGASCSLGAACSPGVIVGTTTITNGTSGYIEYNNGGVLGELGVTGTAGSVVLSSAPTIASLTVTTAFTATGLVTNTDLANASTTVNGQTCTLGSTCTVTIGAGALTGTTLNSGVVTSSLTSVGTLAGLTVTGSFTATGLVTNADLVNASTTVNGQTCTLGSTCTISASAGAITVGTTTIASGTSNGLLYNNAAVLGNLATANNGVLITSGSGVPSISTTLPSGIAATNIALTTPSLGVATATSIAIGGASLGGSAFAITGASVFNSSVTFNAALTYGGVTLNNSVTGSGNMVLATSPTLTTPILGVAAGTSLALGGASIGSNALAVTGTSAFAGTTNSGSMLVSGTSAPSLSNGNATVYAATVNGGIFSGQGSTNDVSLENKSGVIAANIPTGTTNFNVVGTLSFGTLSSTSLGTSPTTITGLTLDGSIVANNDYLMVYSASSGAILKATVASIISSGVAGVSSLNGLTGGLSIVAGTDIAVTAVSSSVTVNFAIPGSSTGVTSFSSPNSGATNYVIAVPATNDTMSLIGTAETFTAPKTFTNSDLLLLGSSTGATTFTSGNASGTNYTATIPANTGTIAETNLAQTWTATQTIPTIVGGTAAGSTLTLQSTSNASPSGDQIVFDTSSFLASNFGAAGGNTQPIWQWKDTGADSGAGYAFEFFAKDSGGTSRLAYIANMGLRVATAPYWDGGIDLITYSAVPFTTSALSNAGSTTLTFSSLPNWVNNAGELYSFTVADATNPSALAVGTTVTATTATTLTISPAVVAGQTVGSGDTIIITGIAGRVGVTGADNAGNLGGFVPALDNAYALGWAAQRWASLYSVTATLGGNSDTGLAPSANTSLYIAPLDGRQAIIDTDTYGTGVFSNWIVRTARGTGASPSNLQSGDVISKFNAEPYVNGAFVGTAQINFIYNDSSPNNGTQIRFVATPAGSTTAAAQMTIGAGINIGTGLTDPGAGNLSVQNHILAQSTSPSISSCGTGSPSVAGSDNFGKITAGGGTLTSCVVNFGKTWGTAPSCAVSGTTSISSLTVTTSTTNLTIGGTSLTSDTINYVCGSLSMLTPANDNEQLRMAA